MTEGFVYSSATGASMLTMTALQRTAGEPEELAELVTRLTSV